MGFDTFAGLALWWPGSIVVSMDSVHVNAGYLAYLLRCVDWVKPVVAAMLYRKTRARRLICCMAPARVWLGSPCLWRALPEAVVNRVCQTCSAFPNSSFRNIAAGASRLVVASLARGHTLREAVRAAAHVCLLVKARQAFTWDHGHAQEESVILTHGGHIPLSVRNADVVAFWVPDFTAVEVDRLINTEANDYWPERVSAYTEAAQYAAKHFTA